MWVKICGVKEIETARKIAQLGPDAIGLNFYPKSVRYVTVAQAAAIRLVIPIRVQAIGVFVNASFEEVCEAVAGASLDGVQLHGDETPEFAARIATEFPQIELVRAWRPDGSRLADWNNYWQQSVAAGVTWSRCLLDARVEGSYGGSGHLADWEMIRQQYKVDTWPPPILAGGITADNVQAAIAAVNPAGIDVASGVESAPGIKDIEKVKLLIERAKNATLSQTA